jgi:hypothetical protein
MDTLLNQGQTPIAPREGGDRPATPNGAAPPSPAPPGPEGGRGPGTTSTAEQGPLEERFSRDEDQAALDFPMPSVSPRPACAMVAHFRFEGRGQPPAYDFEE